jgi:hypothetical protein
MPLDLVVPDLLLPADAPERLRAARLPALERWLARADIVGEPVEGPQGWLAARYALGDPAPVAAISLAGEGVERAGEWLRADPVHLRIDHDALVLHDASILDARRDEASMLVAALQSHFARDGLEFIAPAPDRWYVRVPDGEAPRTTPLWKAFGRNVFGLLPEGKGTINWRSAITEAQMTLGGHEVNRRREEAGQLAINSVWFWGEGERPPALAKRYDLVHADHEFARGLGVLSGAQVRPLPKGIAGIDLVPAGRDALAVIGSLSAPLHRADATAWLAAAAALDENWFASLGDAIARFDAVRLILPAAPGTRIATLTGASRWRVFRSRKPLAAHA